VSLGAPFSGAEGASNVAACRASSVTKAMTCRLELAKCWRFRGIIGGWEQHGKTSPTIGFSWIFYWISSFDHHF
jgi:hypothetical protein